MGNMNEMFYYAGGITALFFWTLTLFFMFAYQIPKKVCYILKLKGYLRFERVSKWFEEQSLKIENEENTGHIKRFIFTKLFKSQNVLERERRDTAKLECEDEEEMWSLE